MADVLSTAGINCPAGGTYSAQGDSQVACSLHGEVATLSMAASGDTPANPTPVTGQGSIVSPTNPPVHTPSPKPTATPVPTATLLPTATPTPAPTAAPPESDSVVTVSENGKSFSIGDSKFSCGTWPELRVDSISLENGWNGLYFDQNSQRIFSEDGKLYLAAEIRWLYKEDLQKYMSIAQYNASDKNNVQDKIRFYELNTTHIYNFDEMSEEELKKTATCGDIIYWNGNYYVVYQEGRTYKQVQWDNNGWQKLQAFDTSVDDETQETYTTITVTNTQLGNGPVFQSVDMSELRQLSYTQIETFSKGTVVTDDEKVYIYLNDVILTGKLVQEDEEVLKKNALELDLSSEIVDCTDSRPDGTTGKAGIVVKYQDKYYVSLRADSYYSNLPGDAYFWMEIGAEINVD
jgi:hypothetical protein